MEILKVSEKEDQNTHGDELQRRDGREVKRIAANRVGWRCFCIPVGTSGIDDDEYGQLSCRLDNVAEGVNPSAVLDE